MAASLELRVSQKAGSQDKEKNTSRVLVELYINTNGGTYNQSGDTGGYIAVDGIQIADLRGKAVYKDAETQLYSGEYEVRHNEDGTKTTTVTAAFDVNTNTRWIYAEQRLTLETIKRASVLTIPVLTMGEASVLTVKKYVENYTHALAYTFGKLNGVVVEKTGNTEIRWTPNLETFAAEQTGPVPTEGELRLTTYAGDGSVVGTNRYSFTAKLPENVVPQITSLVLEPISDSVPAEWFALVQGKSRVRYTAYADGLYGAGIKSCVFSFGNQTVEGERGETKILNTAGGFEPTLTVTDTRNRTATVKMAAWEVYEYSPPTLDASYAYRSDGAGNKGDGTYVTAYGKASCYSVGGNNSVELRMRSRTSGGEWKDDYPALTSGIEKRFSGFDKDKTYEVEIYAVDTIGERTPVPYIIETERVAFHLKGDKDGGAAFGKYAEKTGVLECEWDAEFRGNVKAEGTVTAADIVIGGRSLLDLLHPVGSYYWSDEPTEPSVLFGGTWVKIEGRFLLGAGANHSVGDTGGEKEHTLTVNEMPNHTHNFNYVNNDRGVSWSSNAINDWGSAYSSDAAVDMQIGAGWSSTGYLTLIGTGGNQPHNNMPPYYTTNIWRRTA